MKGLGVGLRVLSVSEEAVKPQPQLASMRGLRKPERTDTRAKANTKRL